MHPAQQIYPPHHGVGGNIDFLGEIRVNQLLPAPFGQDLHQCFHDPEILDLRYFAEILAGKLFLSKGVPPTGKPEITAEKGFRESAMFPQGIPIRR